MAANKVLLLVSSALLGSAMPCLAADEGSRILAEVCSECHSAKRQPLDNLHLTRGDWSDTLERMVSYGVEIPKGKIPVLLDYLVKTQGPAGTRDGAKK